MTSTVTVVVKWRTVKHRRPRFANSVTREEPEFSVHVHFVMRANLIRKDCAKYILQLMRDVSRIDK
jgi:hypothetical protein